MFSNYITFFFIFLRQQVYTRAARALSLEEMHVLRICVNESERGGSC